MAGKPDPNIPDSVTLSQFSGIKNTVAPERLAPTELEKAVNVDIDDSGQVRRRRGYTEVATGSFHSLYEFNGRTYGVKNNSLGVIRPDYSFTGIVGVSAEPISYTSVQETLYYSSRTHAGKITGETHSTWGQTDGQGEWWSPVVSPTSTLGAVAGKLLGDPPKAEHIAAYKGRIYLATGRTIWATEVYQYDAVDRTRGFMQLEHEITLLMAMSDGLYAGTTGGLYFLGGVYGSMQLVHVHSSPVVGPGIVVPAQLVHLQAGQAPLPTGEAIVFICDGGLHAGFDGGTCFNLTEGRVELPKAQSAALLFRQEYGGNVIVAVTDSGGTPTANARIGDHVDAEIIRFQGG